MAAQSDKIDELIERARRGDEPARRQLLEHLARQRVRLRQMIAVRMDARLVARVDPSDIVQEALADAIRYLTDYLRDRPLPLYLWLRRLAWERLVAEQRRHIGAQRRSVTREERWDLPLPDRSAAALVDRLLATGTSPSHQLIREERRQRVLMTLADLPPRDREVLVLRYLEQLSTGEIAAVLGISEGAVMTRHTRALARLRGL